MKPADAKLLDGMVDPSPFPAWMSEPELKVYADAFRARVSRPAQPLPGAGDRFLRLRRVRRQTRHAAILFRWGRTRPRAPVHPRSRPLPDSGAACSDFRGSVIVPRVGHWVQQEAPDATNAALEGFLAQIKQGRSLRDRARPCFDRRGTLPWAGIATMRGRQQVRWTTFKRWPTLRLPLARSACRPSLHKAGLQTECPCNSQRSTSKHHLGIDRRPSHVAMALRWISPSGKGRSLRRIDPKLARAPGTNGFDRVGR